MREAPSTPLVRRPSDVGTARLRFSRLVSQIGRAIWPRHDATRDTGNRRLAALSRTGADPHARRVLVDAAWDNPNHWMRYALVRGALGLGAGREVAMLGPHRAGQIRRTLRHFGIRDSVRLV